MKLSASELPETGSRLLRWAFAAVILVFVLVNCLSVASIFVVFGERGVQAKSREIVENMLTGTELISRIGRDVNRERILVDTHIFETRPESMTQLEAEIAELRVDIAAAVSAYGPLITSGLEVETSRELEVRVERVEADIDRVLALSRRNQNNEARGQLTLVEDDFDAVSQKVRSLATIKREQALRVLGEVRTMQRSAVILIAVLTALGASLSVVIAVWVTRLFTTRASELRKMSLLLEERNRELDAFAGRVAHDLRGPLTAISFASSALSKRDLHEAPTAAILQRGVGRMESIIQDLLTLSRVGQQSATVECDPAPVAAAVEEDLAPRVKDGGGVVHLDVEHAHVHCSEGLLRQALWNLADNAVKYRRPGVQLALDIEGRVTGHSYELRVSDNGLGMSPEETRQAFDPFYRAKGVSETPGTGLGLSIVRRIVEACGGAVAVDSHPERGTTFDIQLPLASPRAAKV